MPYDPNEYFTSPDEDAAIWRYMDLPKFLHLLSSSTLYFTNLAKLPDSWEGKWTSQDIESLQKLWKDLPGRLNAFMQMHQDTNAMVYVNCWHVNRHESAAMWNIYASRGSGIAVKTSFKSLRSAFELTKDTVNVGLVEYKDYATEALAGKGWIGPSLTKRKSFEYENELRAVVVGTGPGLEQQSGIAIPIDVTKLIEYVYVAPQTPDWESDLLKQLIEKFGYTYSPIHSSLDDKALY